MPGAERIVLAVDHQGHRVGAVRTERPVRGGYADEQIVITEQEKIEGDAAVIPCRHDAMAEGAGAVDIGGTVPVADRPLRRRRRPTGCIAQKKGSKQNAAVAKGSGHSFGSLPGCGPAADCKRSMQAAQLSPWQPLRSTGPARLGARPCRGLSCIRKGLTIGAFSKRKAEGRRPPQPVRGVVGRGWAGGQRARRPGPPGDPSRER